MDRDGWIEMDIGERGDGWRAVQREGGEKEGGKARG